MLWDLIYEFYVRYIFGGVGLNNTPYNAFIGYSYDGDMLSNTDIFIKLPFFNSISEQDNFYYSIGNYMSLIATIITMILILVVCFTIIKKCFNIFNRVF